MFTYYNNIYFLYIRAHSNNGAVLTRSYIHWWQNNQQFKIRRWYNAFRRILVITDRAAGASRTSEFCLHLFCLSINKSKANSEELPELMTPKWWINFCIWVASLPTHPEGCTHENKSNGKSNGKISNGKVINEKIDQDMEKLQHPKMRFMRTIISPVFI